VPRPRDSGAGSVFRRPDSRFWWIAYRAHGRTIQQSTKTTKEHQAWKILRARLAKAAEGPPELRQGVTLGELRQMLLDDYEANGRRSTTRVARSSLNAVERLGGEGVVAKDVGVAEVTALIARRRAEKAANATINRELAALRRMFRLGVRAGRLDRRPDFALLREDNARRGFLERPQLEAIQARLPADLRDLVLVAYVTGWRTRSEVLSRQWQHLDLAQGWLRLEPGETKNRRGRMFPLTPELQASLRRRRALTTAFERKGGNIVPWIFHRDGEQVRYPVLLAAWRGACQAAGLPGRYLHDMRRSAVRNLERAGVPRSAAMAMVGHETESIYRRYAIVDEAMLREAAVKLAAGGAGRGRRSG
jgi:integrase